MDIATTRGIAAGIAITVGSTAVATAVTGDLQEGSAWGMAANLFVSPLALAAVTRGNVANGAFAGAIAAGTLTGLGINLAATGAKALE